MSRYVLDTDHVSLILCNHPQVVANATQHEITVTIITVQELFNGWVGRINDEQSQKRHNKYHQVQLMLKF